MIIEKFNVWKTIFIRYCIMLEYAFFRESGSLNDDSPFSIDSPSLNDINQIQTTELCDMRTEAESIHKLDWGS